MLYNLVLLMDNILDFVLADLKDWVVMWSQLVKSADTSNSESPQSIHYSCHKVDWGPEKENIFCDFWTSVVFLSRPADLSSVKLRWQIFLFPLFHFFQTFNWISLLFPLLVSKFSLASVSIPRGGFSLEEKQKQNIAENILSLLNLFQKQKQRITYPGP